MDIPFFSIIIPVYNGLSHDLPICLDSIWSQPIDTSLYEVICVDDCSIDATREWLREQVINHCNLFIVENEVNIRQGGARNIGVKKARGKYLMFIDQDDYYHHDGVKKVYDVLQNENLDVLVTDSAFEFKGCYTEKLQLNFKYQDVCAREEFIEKNGVAIAPWRLIIQRSFYLEHDFIFEENVRMEDIDWGIKVIFYVRTIQYKPILLVHYIKSDRGTTDVMYKNKDILIDNIKAGNRALNVITSLYSGYASYFKVVSIVGMYYNFSCKYLFGIYLPVSEKVNIIKMIPSIGASLFFVNLAQKMPILYSILSNVGIPFFRIGRKLFRFIRKKKNNLKYT